MGSRYALRVGADEITPQLFPRFADAVGPSAGGPARDHCRCVGYSAATRPATVSLHGDRQDTEAAGWKHLLALIDEAVADGRTVFKPFVELSAPERRQIVTLPPDDRAADRRQTSGALRHKSGSHPARDRGHDEP